MAWISAAVAAGCALAVGSGVSVAAVPAARPVTVPASHRAASGPSSAATSSAATSEAIAADGTVVPAVGAQSPFVSSAFSQPLPADQPLAADSASLAAAFVAQYQANYGSVAVNDGAYGYTLETVTAAQPTATVTVAPGCNDFTATTGTQIPIPADTVPPSGTDGSVVIYQPSTDTEWELWQLRTTGVGTWSACWGGRIDQVSASSGIFPDPGGVAASGVSFLATMITEAQVEAGAIDHTLFVELVDCNGSIAPADRTDCGSDPGQPAEGTWFRFPAGLSMPAGLTPFAQMVFHALQTYGAIDGDRAGAVGIQTEDPSAWTAQGNTGTDPITASFAGQPEYAALAGMPWSDLEVIQPPASMTVTPAPATTPTPPTTTPPTTTPPTTTPPTTTPPTTTPPTTAPPTTAPPATGPIVTAVWPPQPLPGDTVTVDGSGFGASQGSNWIAMRQNGILWGVPGDGAGLAVDSWSSQQITFTLPEASGPHDEWSLVPGPADLAVSVGGTLSALSTVDVGGAVARPVVAGVGAVPGQEVTIDGTGFGAVQGIGYVELQQHGVTWGKPGTGATFVIDSWSPTAITFTVPTPSGPGGEWALRPGPARVSVDVAGVLTPVFTLAVG